MRKILQKKLSLSSSPRSNKHYSFRVLLQALQVQRTQKIALFAGSILLAFHVLFQKQCTWCTPQPLVVSDGGPYHPPTTSANPQPVYLWPFAFETQAYNTEIVQVAYNGILESPSLTFTTDRNDPNAVWIGDTGNGYWYGWYPWARHHVLQFLLRLGLLGRHEWGYDRTPWCAAFLREIRSAQHERRKHGFPLQWSIYILDLTDFSKVLRCPAIEQAMGAERVFYGKRSIVQGRAFSDHQQWTRLGHKIDLPSSYRHTPLIVRTDTVQSLHEVLVEHYNQTLASPIEQLPRSIDVAHFWSAAPVYTSYKSLKRSRSRLRNLVSDIITELGDEFPHIHAFVGFAGSHGSQGRFDVASAYIEALLDAKIVVVTQTDRWEDHYRLYEALVTGSMVITDRMLSLPRGLVNGTSVVECTSRDDLRSKILYYLSHPEERIPIARQGRYVAMSQHRSWHRMEELIFGTIRTHCALDNSTGCPFVVHAS
jgi:hypothetical protein